MKRRDFLKGMAVAPAVAVVPVDQPKDGWIEMKPQYLTSTATIGPEVKFPCEMKFEGGRGYWRALDDN